MPSWPATTSDAPTAWIRGPLLVTLTATDAASGAARTCYRLNAGTTATYTAPILLNEGNWAIEFWSVDAAGNRESTKTANAKVDWSPPVTTDNAPAGWVSSRPVTVTLTASDAVSGVRGPERGVLRRTS